MTFTDGLSFTRISVGWLITRHDALNGTALVCQGDLLRVRAIFSDHNVVRVF
jgi:hypothetical protein